MMTFALVLVLGVLGVLGVLAILALVLRDSQPSERPELVRAVAELLGRRRPPR
ncbi:MAG: hypothetical protein ACRDRA_09095 [Pseudonocardiaceae bacterium]